MSAGATDEPRAEPLVIALASAAGATAACARHGDLPTARVIREVAAVYARAAAWAGGEVVKGMGDGLLLAFPPGRARDAVAALREAREEADRLWRAFDRGCAAQVRATAGTVLRGTFGPPGDARPDIYGDVLNRLFKTAPASFTVTPELEALL